MTQVMISTPVNSFNFYSRLLEMIDRDTGEKMFLVFELELICARCKKKEKGSEDCRHNLRYYERE